MSASYSILYEEGEGGISQRPTHETFSGLPPINCILLCDYILSWIVDLMPLMM